MAEFFIFRSSTSGSEVGEYTRQTTYLGEGLLIPAMFNERNMITTGKPLPA